ncbi:MAG: DMT family transporter [Anaerolineae bacterium]|nr:DMT family transporter [Anaerolineae bacterium]
MSQPAQAAAADRSVSPVLVMLIGVLAVSTASIFIRYAQQSGAGSLAIAALRLTFATLVLVPPALLRCREEYRTLSGRDFVAALISGAFLGAHFATWIFSLEFTTIVSSVVLVTLSPLFVALGSALFLRERLLPHVLLGMGMAITGGIVIGLADAGSTDAAPNPLLGNALALAGAMSIAPYLIIGRALRHKLSLLAYVALVYGAAAVVLFGALLVSGGSPLLGSPVAYLWIALLALVPQLVGHTSFNWSVRRLPAVYGTVPILGEPIGSSILAVLLLGEVIRPPIVLGAALTLGGIWLMSVRRDA